MIREFHAAIACPMMVVAHCRLVVQQASLMEVEALIHITPSCFNVAIAEKELSSADDHVDRLA